MSEKVSGITSSLIICFAHLFFQLADTLAGRLADLIQWIEPRIYHLHQVLTHKFAG